MTIIVKKAGEVVAKAAVKAASTTTSRGIPNPGAGILAANAAAKTAVDPQIVLKEPRAVSASEAYDVLPSKTSTTTSLMPWTNWFDSWLVSNFGQHRLDQWRNVMNFMPDDIYDLQQSPKPAQKIQTSKTDPTKTAMWRYPSPGSRGSVHVPEFDVEQQEDPFDNSYYKRDTRRRYLNSETGDSNVEQLKLDLMDDNDPDVIEERKKQEAGPTSSPGCGGMFATGPSTFDTTGGLRSTIGTNWKATNASLDANMPNHLPTPIWMGNEDAVEQWYKERNLPVCVGAVYEPLTKVPIERRIAQW